MASLGLRTSATTFLLAMSCVLSGVESYTPDIDGTCTHEGEVFYSDIYLPNCPAPRCVDFETPLGACCGVCPEDENCWLNGALIPAGQMVVQGPPDCQEVCRCPYRLVYEEQGRDTQAVCVEQC